MARNLLRLTPGRRDEAHAWVEKALRLWQPGSPWTLEIREPKRSDEQNAALHGLIQQIIRQRPMNNGVRMDMALWKASFMQAMGEEIRFVPTLDGDGVFPIGLSTSALSKARFSELIEFVLAWCAREGIEVEHFGEQDNQRAA
jgi:hypothetical protein